MSSINRNLTVTVNRELDVIPRSYQIELVEQAKSENLIVCLPTGSGKTYIAVMLIKEMSSSVRLKLTEGGKRTIFLVKTVQLAEQQSNYIHTHTDLTIKRYYGDMGVDRWGKEIWKKEFDEHQVLVMTAQVFLDVIDHKYFSLDQVNLIIFDECHHASGDDRYAALMNKHYDKCSSPRPRVLGLTASISAKKIKAKDLLNDAKELEKIYRARIATGSNRKETIEHGTSVQVETIPCSSYRDQILKENESLMIPFEILRFMANQIQSRICASRGRYETIERKLAQTMLTSKYQSEDAAVYTSQSSEFTSFIQENSFDLPRLKRSLDNLIEIGYELGLWPLFLFAKDLRKRFRDYFLLVIDSITREMLEDCSERLNCVIDDILRTLCYLHDDRIDILFSPKVLRLLDRLLQQESNGRSIVFVERIYTAAILSKSLTHINAALPTSLQNKLKVKHVTGTNAMIAKSVVTLQEQRQTIKDFRDGKINVLIATAVIEEGLDIPQCDLVIRFNKPSNFSSYMQSKGRARAKQNAAYVLFMDQSNAEVFDRDQTEYKHYEEIEKIIQQGFSLDPTEDDESDDPSTIPPYVTSTGVVIDATRAAQLIMQYCVLLGNGQLFPPRFLFHGVVAPFTCILSMPANCPVRDDIFCEHKRKKLAKYLCCLEMVKKLHQRGHFDEHCRPNRNRTLIERPDSIARQIFKLVDRMFDERTDGSLLKIPRRISSFPMKLEDWSLYRIDHQFGLATPCSSLKIPRFCLYGSLETHQIEVIYVKSVDLSRYRSQLEEFSRYLFETVFTEMNPDSLLHFDFDRTTFQLFPCLLTNSDEIDLVRMKSICRRTNEVVKNLSEDELYVSCHLSPQQMLTYKSDRNLRKRVADRCDFETKSERIETYADFFESKQTGIRFERDAFLVTTEPLSKVRINYLHETTKKSNNDHSTDIWYFPVEFLRYAPLNRSDWESFHRWPSILVRISQLYRIERLRKLFADNVRCCESDETVTFTDCLLKMEPSSILPLIRLNYDLSSSSSSRFQLSSDILFQSITRRSAGEQTDMENLEILGDCFLKLAVSMCLYQRYPLAGAGSLSVEKSKEISNENLFRLAIEKKLLPYLNATKIQLRGTEANWCPPGFVVNTSGDSRRYTHQQVKRKAIADMIEAFIGAYLISTNYSVTLEFMKWLGIDVIPLDEKNQLMDVPSILCSGLPTEDAESALTKFYNEQDFSQFESLLGYEFHQKGNLIAAFTHPSSFANRLTNCYERLEFLGDAVLDFLVTRHIFNVKKDITPSLVTDIRQDLSNNGRLAYILVAYRLHTKILHNSPNLFGKISAYAGDEELFPKDSSIDEQLNKEIDQWADSTAPKALADVFEALVGAIFLDSGKCLKTVWNVVEPLLHQYIDRSISKANVNPIRSFFESGGKLVSEYSIKDDSKTVCIYLLETKDGQRIEGRGDNKKSAKFDACRKAMKS